MKVYLKDIANEGLSIEGSFPSDVIELTDKDLLKVTAPLKVHADVNRVQNMILANTTVKTQYHAVCHRCLEDIEKEWTQNFILDFPVPTTTDFIDLSDDIRQEMILAIPTILLCKEDCKGICAGCGVNLNQEGCQCKGA